MKNKIIALTFSLILLSSFIIPLVSAGVSYGQDPPQEPSCHNWAHYVGYPLPHFFREMLHYLSDHVDYVILGCEA